MSYLKLKDEQEVIENLQKLLEKISNDSIKEKGAFFVGFSGISLISYWNFQNNPLIFSRWILRKIFMQRHSTTQNRSQQMENLFL